MESLIMPLLKKYFRSETFLTILLIVLTAALCYLTMARSFGFYNDDWYLMYGGMSRGAIAFPDIFSADRPFRGTFMAWLWPLFGPNALLYSLSGFALRVIAALGVYWLIRLVWPDQRRAAGLVALLSAVYPGFLSQPQAIDYQSHLVAFALAILSIAFNLKAIFVPRLWQKGLLLLLAILCQVIALLLMEYYVGFEGLRLALIFSICLRQEKNLRQRLIRTVLRMVPAGIGMISFLYWRTSIFSNKRGPTDIYQMAHDWLASPLTQTGDILLNMVRDILSVTVFAWGVPFYSLLQPLDLGSLLVALGAAFLAGALTWLAISRLKLIGANPPDPAGGDRSDPAGYDLIWIGLFAVAVSLIPINFGDRSVVFSSFSRFTLPGSVGACMAVTGLLMALARARLATWAPVVLVALAAATHIANGYSYANSWSLVKNFWWQVAWRAPNITENTVIVASYANQGIGEDYFVWAPASMIYDPKITNPGDPITLLSAVTLDKSDIQAVLDGVTITRFHRRIAIPLIYRQSLVLTLPSPGVCVHAIDGTQPELSTNDRSEIYVVAPRSQIDLIQTDAAPHQPPASVFGAEPAHDWCYYYQKASLARQKNDWAEIVRLGDEAAKAGLNPNDPVEWMPFLEAFATVDRTAKIDLILESMKKTPYLQYQACQLFQHKGGAGPNLPADVLNRLAKDMCPPGPASP
jgi:hypothetical protein